MTPHDSLERELAAWFGEIATPSIPDYTDDILRATARRRQRPTWTFLERWLPMHAQTLERVPTTPFPWRTIGLLAVIAILTAALIAATVGSIERRPEPFGLAANGLIAYVDDGGRGISAVDPATGARVRLATGTRRVEAPRWSLDGTRIAFIRHAEGGMGEVVVVDVTDRDPQVVISPLLAELDPDGIEWAPDGRQLLLVHGRGERRLGLMDVTSGTLTDLARDDYLTREAFFRPPDGREVAFLTDPPGGQSVGIAIVGLDGMTVRDVPLAPGDDTDVRIMGWMPDGDRLVVHRPSPVDGVPRTFLVEPETGDEVALDVAYGHVSHDGRWVAGLSLNGPETVCVVSVEGGPCVTVSDGSTTPDGTHGKGLVWSPDDEWLVVTPYDSDTTVLFDPDRGREPAPPHVPDGIESWQRRAP